MYGFVVIEVGGMFRKLYVAWHAKKSHAFSVVYVSTALHKSFVRIMKYGNF